ncbi:MAG TPA: sigma-70 family RNA polymerase sigma factor [Dokdonella sp.]|uniref:RNA polymerase sigma factor n=1 Tax=Dokdonella sp. TaxID=2291710 RepID=UPI0025C5150E|nr:sigma-70 family RNA polymerase sigma factor [Dokdonella sp.]MBX3691328.1 sigma-70 family RNA polymerase sigma factor [Dokdonella sp.]MCW5569096.1 sigma-70 family RNA polymerase sigma factor [Dokdonella sp.]HNR90822.1 sigma-70 family RNA polymerase sigma factor [Dokdonella sp.]
MSNGFGQELDALTLERARRGDVRAFEAIYRMYARACYTLALRILGDAGAAEDVMQEVFLRVLSMLRGFRGDAPFGAWLKRLTANATIDVIRRNRRFDGDDAALILETTAAGGTDGELAADAWSLLQRLPPRARAVLLLHEVEGYTHRELGALFGQSESYSKSILARTLKQLGDMMGTKPAHRTTVDDDHA